MERFRPHRRLADGFTLTVFDSARRLRKEDWEKVREDSSLFLHPDYLEEVEKCVGPSLRCRYVIVYRDAEPCGIFNFQISSFSAGLFGDLISREVASVKVKRSNLFARYIEANREEVMMQLLTCGNNLISGPHGFAFNSAVQESQQPDMLLAVTDLMAREEKLKKSIASLLLKDFTEPIPGEFLGARIPYAHLSVEPVMMVNLPPGLTSLEQYTALFSKKYRNRARRILESRNKVRVFDAGTEEIARGMEALYPLYEQVYAKAKFRLLKLRPGYFVRCSEIFGNRFLFRILYEGDTPVAFASGFVAGDILESHYIGLDYGRNQDLELYQNLLYLFVEEGIKHGCRIVNLGRTAAEIKTTVGAVPQEMHCYIRPMNGISRLLQRFFISYLRAQPFTARNPFKEENAIHETS
jgi:hypothetical protein